MRLGRIAMTEKFNSRIVMKPHRTARYGFSLVEIIIAISIILVLAVVSLSVASKWIDSAELNKCAARVRHLGVSVLSYAAEENNILDFFAGGKAGTDALWANVLYQRGIVVDKHLFRCEQGEAAQSLSHGAWPWFTYGMNMLTPPGITAYFPAAGGVTEYRYRLSLNSVADPAYHMFLYDSGISSAQSNMQIFRMDSIGKGGIKLRHSGKANVFFLDGHLEAMNRKQIEHTMDMAGHEIPNWNYIHD